MGTSMVMTDQMITCSCRADERSKSVVVQAFSLPPCRLKACTTNSSQSGRKQRCRRVRLLEEWQLEVHIRRAKHKECGEDSAEHQAGQLDRIYGPSKGPITCILRILPERFARPGRRHIT